ncbi:CDP-alcohol phosphatidyltransferase family protein [Verrucosispora sp. WMMC514]|uniref:CDP-alcohol phosphatidyltransferase family protein n=1 Tax=Verrucosispora sp. WMMC514 TaxID=3015156 RepID=UPI00248BB123|nr:CDP-alcohol phosphatidyltransferase family protein [Verrucosispora sp. WMMC514]WBB89342.1 CDP-alcohol phosphatidyltransferase family protein [Verrucosispora sp. WMMC514]
MMGNGGAGGGLTVAEVQARTYKARDSWWTVFLVDPLASRLVWLVARYRWVTPNRLTVAALVLGLAAAAAFAQATPGWLILGALIFHLSFVVDCMDGKVARLNGTGTLFGAWLDYILDRVRVLVCTIALMGGQYQLTGDATFLVIGGGIVFLDMFRYLNALQLSKVKTEMRRTLAERIEASPNWTALFAPDHSDEPLENVEPSVAAVIQRPDMAMERDFRARFTVFTRLRDLLIRARVRVHVMSGIEFQMAVFIIGPITGAVIAVSVIAGVLLLAFEFALIFKLWLATRSFARYDSYLEGSAPGSSAVPTQATVPAGMDAKA